MKDNLLNVISTNKNISEYPEQRLRTPHPQVSNLTIGDLHGNPVKLIHFLIQEDILNLNSGDYKSFVTLYDRLSGFNIDLTYSRLDNNPNIGPFNPNAKKPQDIKVLNELFTIIQKIEIKDKKHLIRLIGDIFADRGHNDAIMITLLEKLHELGLKFTIMNSNHDLNFQAYVKEGFNLKRVQYVSNMEKNGFSEVVNSLRQFDANRKLIGFDDNRIKKFLDTIYYPNLKLVDYDLTANGIVIYTHAPVEMADIAGVCSVMRTKFEYSDMSNLMQTIDRINSSFNKDFRSDGTFPIQCLNGGDVHGLKTYKDLSGNVIDYSNLTPYDRIHWWRASQQYSLSNYPNAQGGYNKIPKEKLSVVFTSKFPAQEPHYSISFVSGHDDQTTYAPDMAVCIDTQAGKDRYTTFNNMPYLITRVLNEKAVLELDIAPEVPSPSREDLETNDAALPQLFEERIASGEMTPPLLLSGFKSEINNASQGIKRKREENLEVEDEDPEVVEASRFKKQDI